jgi:hypothetical protein
MSKKHSYLSFFNVRTKLSFYTCEGEKPTRIDE